MKDTARDKSDVLGYAIYDICTEIQIHYLYLYYHEIIINIHHPSFLSIN